MLHRNRRDVVDGAVVSQFEFCRDRRVSRRGMALTAFSSSNDLRLQMPYPMQESTFDVIELRQ